MGGGGGKTPEPTKFTPPPLQDGPAKNPIPNFFGAQAGGARQNPFAALGQIGTAQAQNPFQGQQGGMQGGQLTPETIMALLAQIRGGR